MNTLASKIAQASRIVGALATDKTNTAQNYSYISADKVLDKAGGALTQVGVAVFPSVISEQVTQVDYTDNYGKGKSRFDAVVHFAMFVSDDEQEQHLSWVGRGSDFSVPDKALYKAITSGHKYFLMKLLNVGVGNEDGEHDVVEEARPSVQDAQTKAQYKPQPALQRVVTPAPKQPVNPFDEVEFNQAKPKPKVESQPTYVYTWQKLAGNEYDLIDWTQKLHRKADSPPCSVKQYGYLTGIMDALTGDNHAYILSLLCQSDISSDNLPSKAAASNLLNLLVETHTVKDDVGNETKGPNPAYRQDLAEMITRLGTAAPIPA